MDNQETNAVWICESCVHGPPSSFGGKPCAVCNPHDPLLNYYQKREGPVTTNADRIRAMSDEELAELWWERVDCGECPVHKECFITGQDCKRRALDWLKREVDSDQT